MNNTVTTECHACGQDIHYFEPYSTEAVRAKIRADQFAGVIAQEVLVGRNWYHKECAPEGQ